MEVTEQLIERRKEFYRENIFIMTRGCDIALNIRKAVSKLLCTMCRMNYRNYNLYVKYFDIAGCDDPRGASSLIDKFQEGAGPSTEIVGPEAIFFTRAPFI